MKTVEFTDEEITALDIFFDDKVLSTQKMLKSGKLKALLSALDKIFK